VKQAFAKISSVEFTAKFIEIILRVFGFDVMEYIWQHRFGIADCNMNPGQDFPGFIN
jgi:hypothetical protein